MLKKLLARFVLFALVLAALTSCGSKAGGTGEFATVQATASAPTGPFDADLVSSWTSSTGTALTACEAGATPTIKPDDVAYTITSTPYSTPNTGQTNPTTASNLIIDKITVVLTPANSDTPALPVNFQTQNPSAGQLITPGSTAVSVTFLTRELKAFIANEIGLTTSCTNAILSYRATVSFEALEVNTNRVATITAPGFLLVNFTDLI